MEVLSKKKSKRRNFSDKKDDGKHHKVKTRKRSNDCGRACHFLARGAFVVLEVRDKGIR